MNKQEAIEELTRAQEWFKQKTYELAESAGMMRSDLWPMPDGVYDIEAYLSSLRVMWVLKEPYDDFVDGKPCGGGWDVYGAFDNSDAWANRTWQPIIYSMYGVFNHLRWRDMDYIRDNPDMVNVLKRIAYINLSKMPAHKQTNDAKLWEYYDIWRPILLQQIEAYAPHVVIFGNTFKYFKKDLVGLHREPDRTFENNAFAIYRKNMHLFIDTYHPNQKTIPRGMYVDNIIGIINDFA